MRLRDSLQHPLLRAASCVACLAILSSAQAQVQDWNNLGGNGRANGLVGVNGPDSPRDLLWQGGPFSWFGWNPVVEGRRVFVVRQAGFPADPVPGFSTIYALSLDTGAVLWTADLPFEPAEWSTWIAGVRDGRVYASRSGNGGSVLAPLYCLSAATGAVLWHTAGEGDRPRHEIRAGPYGGAVFASDGDIIIPSLYALERFDAVTGELLWSTPRFEQVGNAAGCVIVGDAIYAADAFSGMRVAIRKYDAETGAIGYRGPLLSGGLLHNAPFVGVDGRIYLPFSQNNSDQVDFLYSFSDTGSAIVQNWRVVSGGGGEFARWGVGPDGAIYSMSFTGTPDPSAEGCLQLLDPATGAVLAQSATIRGDYMKIQMVVDARGVLYVSNGTSGGAGRGRLFSFNPDLTERWSIPIAGNVNQGGPVLATDGTLVLASTDNFIAAWRTGEPPCVADMDGSGTVDSGDVALALLDYGPCPECAADLDGTGYVDFGDIAIMLLETGPCGI